VLEDPVNTKTVRILLVEDNPDDVRMVREMVREVHNQAIHSVDSLAAGLEELNTRKWDVILLDLGLPDSQGLQTLKRVMEADYPLPVVILTGQDDEAVGQEAVREGAQDYLCKGHVDERSLTRSIRYAIERKRAERELIDSEARFRTYMERTPEGVFLIDDTGHYLQINPSACRITGYTEQEMLQMSVTDLLSDISPEDGLEHFRRLMDTGFATNDLWLKRKDGSIFCLTIDAVKLSEKVSIGFCKDITWRKQAESALEASEVRYRRLFESAKDGILILDAATGAVMDVNPFLTDLLGYSLQEFQGKKVWELGFLQDIIHNHNNFAELQEKGYIRYEDIPLQTATGQRIDVEFISNVYMAGDQKVVQCNIRNITERLRADKALFESEERFRGLFEHAALGIYQTTPDGQILAANPALCQMLGYTTLEHMQRQNLNNPELFTSVPRSQYMMEMEKTGYILGYEASWKKTDGTTLFVRESARTVRDSNGKTIYFEGYLEDITEQKRIEAERIALEDQLRTSQRMEAIGNLAGGIAHDFNNLLGVILSFTGFSLKAVAEGTPLQNDLLEVKKAAERAAVLTRQLLAFSRKQVLQPVQINLNNIIENLDKMLKRIIGEDIQLVYTLAPDLGLTIADPGQIEQVLMNLVVNARDAMPDGGILTIETRNLVMKESDSTHNQIIAPGPYIEFTVSDTGYGMDEQTRNRIFEPFFTTKRLGKGTGLGLSMVYGIIKQSDGNIFVSSKPGEGSSFKVYLPRASSAIGAVTTESSEVTKRPAEHTTILLVEDEDSLRKATYRILQEAGYAILAASDGEEALKQSAKYTGDITLLLTDVVMPGIGGSALAENLLITRPAIKVIFMSGYTDSTIVQHGVKDLKTNFIAKPFSETDLLRKVQETLDRDNAVQHGHASVCVTLAEEHAIDKAALLSVPNDILAKLRTAVSTARFDDAIDAIEIIRTLEPEAASALRRMAELYDYDSIRQLL
jgi:PAS domain S-box-containing protein